MSAKLFSEIVNCSQCNASGPAREHLGHDTQGFGGRLRFCPCCLDVFYVQMNCVSWSSLCCDSCNRKAEETDDKAFLAKYDRAEMRKRAYLKYHTINNKVVRLVERAAARLEAARVRAINAAENLWEAGKPAPYPKYLDSKFYAPGSACFGTGLYCDGCSGCKGVYRFFGDGWCILVFRDRIIFERLIRKPYATVAQWETVAIVK